MKSEQTIFELVHRPVDEILVCFARCANQQAERNQDQQRLCELSSLGFVGGPALITSTVCELQARFQLSSARFSARTETMQVLLTVTTDTMVPGESGSCVAAQRKQWTNEMLQPAAVAHSLCAISA